MTTIERVNANTANGNMKMGLGSFGNSMKPKFDGGAALNEGDILIFPTLAEMGNLIGSQEFRGNQYEFLVIEVQAPDGSKRAINWFPTTFQNPVFEWSKDEAGNVYRTTNILYPEGDAVDAFLSERGKNDTDADGKIIKSDTQKGIEHLASKKVKVDSKTMLKTVAFDKDGNQDTSRLVDKALFHYSFVA